MKVLVIGGLLLSPAVALWLRASPAAAVTQQRTPESELVSAVTRVPVEVLEEGKSPEWVYIDVPAQSVPEPGLFSLLALAAAALTLRRSRSA